MKLVACLLCLGALSMPTFATEERCLNQGDDEIVLVAAPEPCALNLPAGDKWMDWQPANVGGEYSCWRQNQEGLVLLRGNGHIQAIDTATEQKLDQCPKWIADNWLASYTTCKNRDESPAAALAACRKAMRLAEHFPESDERLPATFNILATRTDNPSEQEQLWRRELQLQQKYHVTFAWRRCLILSGMAQAQSDQGRLNAAVQSHRDAIKCAEQEIGENHLETVSYRLFLAKTLILQDNYSAAEPLLKNVLAVAPSAPGDLKSEGLGRGLAYVAARILVDVYEALDNPALAARYQRLATELKPTATPTPEILVDPEKRADELDSVS